MITDLTVGPPRKLLVRFSLPLLFSVIFQQLYNITDSVIAGNILGSGALAAIGASHPITLIFMAIAQGCNIGCSVTISHLYGAHDNRQVKTAVYTALTGVLSVSLFLTALGLALSGTVLKLLNTPDSIFESSSLYLNIYISGLVFLFLYNICNGISTALGDSKTPLIFLIISSAGNVILDIIFLHVFKMGVEGTAWATLICQAFCSLLAFYVLLRRIHELPCMGKPQIFSGKMMLRISRIAIPSILQQSFVSVGNLFVQGIVNSFGADTIAGFSSAQRLNALSLSCIGTLGNGISSFTAQNIGANKPERIAKGFRAAFVITMGITAVFSAASFIFAEQLIGLFLNAGDSLNDGVVSAGVTFLRIVSPFYAIVASKLVADGVLRGSGSMLFFMTATFSDLIFRVGLSYALSPLFGAQGICVSWPIGWTLGAILSLLFYTKVKRRGFMLRS